MSKNTVGFIFIGIISIAGLALGGYNFLTAQIFVAPEESGYKLVGIWDGLDDNLNYPPHITSFDWLFEFEQNSYIDLEYISVSNNNTRITLMKQGWYRIQISVLLYDLDVARSYRIDILKNGTILFYLDFIVTEIGYEPSYYNVHAEGYVLSDGNDYIEINGLSTGDPFYPYAIDQKHNQLVLEFVSII